MIFEKTGNLHLYKFDSFEEYLDRAQNPVFKLPAGPRSSGWTESGLLQNHIDMARYGNPTALEKIEDWRDLVVKDISSQLPKPQYHYDTVGSMWDIGRVVEGDPECWIVDTPSDEIERDGKGNLIRFVINTASSAEVFSSFHTNRCGAILALAQLLEMMGFYVQFEITTALTVGSRKLEFRTIAKRAGEVFNMAALSYWASGDMERRIDFAICETMHECIRHSKYHGDSINYGGCVFTSDPGDICFDRGSSADVNWYDEKSARKYIVDQLKNQGIVLDTDQQHGVIHG
jgi:hypothetical protein